MVYVIIQGEYSDQQVVGYCTSEELAEKACAFKRGDSEEYWDSCRYEVVECLDDIVENTTVNYLYRVDFKSRMISPNQYMYEVYRVYEEGITPSIGYSRISYNNTNNVVSPIEAVVYVSVNRIDEKLAQKVAIDALYKDIAEKAGL